MFLVHLTDHRDQFDFNAATPYITVVLPEIDSEGAHLPNPSQKHCLNKGNNSKWWEDRQMSNSVFGWVDSLFWTFHPAKMNIRLSEKLWHPFATADGSSFSVVLWLILLVTCILSIEFITFEVGCQTTTFSCYHIRKEKNVGVAYGRLYDTDRDNTLGYH